MSAMVTAAEVGITTTILWGIGGDMAALAVFPVRRMAALVSQDSRLRMNAYFAGILPHRSRHLQCITVKEDGRQATSVSASAVKLEETWKRCMCWVAICLDPWSSRRGKTAKKGTDIEYGPSAVKETE
jgi:hypothetical protein